MKSVAVIGSGASGLAAALAAANGGARVTVYEREPKVGGTTALSGGNVCSEDLVHMLQRAGIRTDISLDALMRAARQAEEILLRQLPGKIHTSGPIPHLEPALA